MLGMSGTAQPYPIILVIGPFVNSFLFQGCPEMERCHLQLQQQRPLFSTSFRIDQLQPTLCIFVNVDN
jgi:hypothetical protein